MKEDSDLVVEPDLSVVSADFSADHVANILMDDPEEETLPPYIQEAIADIFQGNENTSQQFRLKTEALFCATIESALEPMREEITQEIAEQYEDRLVELEEICEILEAERTFDSVAEGMTTIAKEKFRELAEGLSYDSWDELEHKLRGLKEQHFRKPILKRTPMFGENNDEMEIPKPFNSEMRGYINTVSKLVGKINR